MTCINFVSNRCQCKHYNLSTRLSLEKYQTLAITFISQQQVWTISKYSSSTQVNNILISLEKILSSWEAFFIKKRHDVAEADIHHFPPFPRIFLRNNSITSSKTIFAQLDTHYCMLHSRLCGRLGAHCGQSSCSSFSSSQPTCLPSGEEKCQILLNMFLLDT